MEIIEYGMLTLGEKVRVSDPCYDSDVWCACTLENMLPGKYKATALLVNTDDWGVRVAQLMICHEDYVNRNMPLGCITNKIGVDAGMCGFWDYDRFKAAKEDENRRRAENSRYTSPFAEEWMHELTENQQQGGILKDGWGVASRSGYGDGCYGLYAARNRDDKVVVAIIDYDVD